MKYLLIFMPFIGWWIWLKAYNAQGMIAMVGFGVAALITFGAMSLVYKIEERQLRKTVTEGK